MRKNEVTLSYDTEQDDDIMSQGRAERLALFLSTIRESPGAFRTIIGAHMTIKDIIAAGRNESATRYGEHLDATDDFPYEDRALYVAGVVLQHGDDMAATPDPETVRAMQHARTVRIRENAVDTEWRVERLGIIAQQIADTLTGVNPQATLGGTDTGAA